MDDQLTQQQQRQEFFLGGDRCTCLQTGNTRKISYSTPRLSENLDICRLRVDHRFEALMESITHPARQAVGTQADALPEPVADTCRMLGCHPENGELYPSVAKVIN